MLGNPPHWPRRTVAGPRLAGGHQVGCLRMPWARTPLGGARGCVWMAATPEGAALSLLGKMSEWESESR